MDMFYHVICPLSRETLSQPSGLMIVTQIKLEQHEYIFAIPWLAQQEETVERVVVSRNGL